MFGDEKKATVYAVMTLWEIAPKGCLEDSDFGLFCYEVDRGLIFFSISLYYCLNCNDGF